jgi:SAM-dependent methyltransferase
VREPQFEPKQRPILAKSHFNGALIVKNMRIPERIQRRDLRVMNKGPLLYTVSSLLHYGMRAAVRRRVVRDVKQISQEYHDKNRTEYWASNGSLDDLIYSDNQTSKWILNGGRLEVGTDRIAREYLLERLEKRIGELLPEGHGTVVEFGCGMGRNLFFLKRKFPSLKLVGLELTPSTVESARKLAREAGLDITFEVADMTKKLPIEGADVAFSVHALEQLPRDFPAAVDNMLAVAAKGAVFFEPVHELFPKTLRGLAARFRIFNADHLNGLVAHLETSANAKIVSAKAMPTVGNPLNQTAEILVARTSPAQS